MRQQKIATAGRMYVQNSLFDLPLFLSFAFLLENPVKAGDQSGQSMTAHCRPSGFKN